MCAFTLSHLVSTHSRAEAAAGRAYLVGERGPVSTHSRAEAAARHPAQLVQAFFVSTHSRAEAAAVLALLKNMGIMFQHTAARRRLPS